MNYVSVEDKAKEWKITSRAVQMHCKNNKIPGAKKQSGTWLIPSTATKPCSHSGEGTLNVLSLFSGCGGMDLGFEGDFLIREEYFNSCISKNWKIKKEEDGYIRLPKTRFETIFANDIKPAAKTAWVNYFKKKGRDAAIYHLDSIVDLVKLEKDNDIPIFPKNVDVVTGGFPCQDFSVAGKRQGLNSQVSHKGMKKEDDEPTIENRGQLYMWMREVIAIVKPKVFFCRKCKRPSKSWRYQRYYRKRFFNH